MKEQASSAAVPRHIMRNTLRDIHYKMGDKLPLKLDEDHDEHVYSYRTRHSFDHGKLQHHLINSGWKQTGKSAFGRNYQKGKMSLMTGKNYMTMVHPKPEHATAPKMHPGMKSLGAILKHHGYIDQGKGRFAHPDGHSAKLEQGRQNKVHLYTPGGSASGGNQGTHTNPVSLYKHLSKVHNAEHAAVQFEKTGHALLDHHAEAHISRGWKYHGKNRSGGHIFKKRNYMPKVLEPLANGNVGVHSGSRYKVIEPKTEHASGVELATASEDWLRKTKISKTSPYYHAKQAVVHNDRAWAHWGTIKKDMKAQGHQVHDEHKNLTPQKLGYFAPSLKGKRLEDAKTKRRALATAIHNHPLYKKMVHNTNKSEEHRQLSHNSLRHADKMENRVMRREHDAASLVEIATTKKTPREHFVNHAAHIAKKKVEHHKIGFDHKDLPRAVQQAMMSMALEHGNPNLEQQKKFLPKSYDKKLYDNGDNNSFDSEWFKNTDAKMHTIVKHGIAKAKKEAGSRYTVLKPKETASSAVGSDDKVWSNLKPKAKKLKRKKRASVGQGDLRSPTTNGLVATEEANMEEIAAPKKAPKPVPHFEDNATGAKAAFLHSANYKPEHVKEVKRGDSANHWYVHTDHKQMGKQTHSLYLPGHGHCYGPHPDFETYDKPGHHASVEEIASWRSSRHRTRDMHSVLESHGFSIVPGTGRRQYAHKRGFTVKLTHSMAKGRGAQVFHPSNKEVPTIDTHSHTALKTHLKGLKIMATVEETAGPKAGNPVDVTKSGGDSEAQGIRRTVQAMGAPVHKITYTHDTYRYQLHHPKGVTELRVNRTNNEGEATKVTIHHHNGTKTEHKGAGAFRDAAHSALRFIKKRVAMTASEEETAAPKDNDHYTWHTFKGQRGVNLHYRGKPHTMLRKGMRFGTRPSSNSKFTRLITEANGKNIVHSISHEHAERLHNRSRKVRTDAKVHRPVDIMHVRNPKTGIVEPHRTSGPAPKVTIKTKMLIKKDSRNKGIWRTHDSV